MFIHLSMSSSSVKGALLTMKSYLVRTAVLGAFFFLLLPLGKAVLVSAGIASLSALGLAESEQHGGGLLGTFFSEARQWAEVFVNVDFLDDFLYS